jgi:hypothetical protein
MAYTPFVLKIECAFGVEDMLSMIFLSIDLRIFSKQGLRLPLFILHLFSVIAMEYNLNSEAYIPT